MPRDHTYFIYMLASRKYGTLYIGVTKDLRSRIERHRAGEGSRFTAKYVLAGIPFQAILTAADFT